MLTPETLPDDRGAALIRGLFDDNHWGETWVSPELKDEDKLPLTVKELRLAASIFEKGVSEVFSGGLDHIALPRESYLQLDNYQPGTLMLLDLETARKGVVPSSGVKLDYSLDYAGQMGYLMNSPADYLIKLQAARSTSETYQPTRFHVSPGVEGWQYTRLAWFAMVVPSKEEGVNGLLSFSSVNPKALTKDLFQNRFSIGSELVQPALIGTTSITLAKDYMGDKVAQYQRLNEVRVYQEPAAWLAKNVYKEHNSVRRLGRRAVRNLSGPCLVRNTK